MKILTTLFFLLTSILAVAEPGWGQYKICGFATLNDSIPISHDTLKIKILGKEMVVVTDENGRYEATITWTTWDFDAGFVDTDGSKIDFSKKSEEMNPPIAITYKERTITIPNYWREENELPENEKGKTRKIDLKF